MPELTPRDDAKKSVSEILKRVDQLIKRRDFEQALLEIERAKEIDPRNVYVHAYEERITVLIEEDRRRRETEEVRRKEEEATRRKLEEEWKKKEEERRQKEEEEKRKLDEERRKREEKIRRAEEEQRSKEEEARRRQLDEEMRRRWFEEYKQAVFDVWADGAATPEEESRLSQLRDSLRIPEEEHSKLEAEAKKQSYFQAFKRAWTNGTIAPEAASSLADLRKRFKISPEEHEKIEVKLLWELRSSRQRSSIVVVDDDDKLLQVIRTTLEEAGFEVKAFTTSDEAYKFMKQFTPDIILSDINLETSTMGGFSFYERVREQDNLHEIPFIFLSGLTDEVLIRTGKELGVDDYITKPFSDQTLIATIKGKLKRYEQLKRARKN